MHHQPRLASATALSDSELLRRVPLLAARAREATVDLVAHLAELDARKLHLREGYGSLFAYCTRELRLAEHAAYNRIEAARLSREFPTVLDLLSDGSLNLSIVRLLAPHLRPDNFEAVVARARGRSKREVELLVAELAPQADVPASVRKLPTPARAMAPKSTTRFELAPTEPGVMSGPPVLSTSPSVAPGPAHGPVVAPLTPERYRCAVHCRRCNAREAASGAGASPPGDTRRRSRRDLRPGADPPARRRGSQEDGDHIASQAAQAHAAGIPPRAVGCEARRVGT